MSFKKSIRDWVKLITGIRACPFAHRTLKEGRLLVYEVGTSIDNCLELSSEFDVGLLPMLGYSAEDLEYICLNLNERIPHMIFLDSHPDQQWKVRGHRTSWEYPAILIQRKDELESARRDLQQRGFYSEWDPEFLKILKVNK